MLKSKNYSEVSYKAEPVLKTGDQILDEFISNDGGFVVGSAIFLTGTSGAGKTTFAFTLQKVFENFVTSLYSREMSAAAVKQQMKRYEISHNNAYIADKESCPTLESYIEELNVLKPKVVIVDSLQVIMKEDYSTVSAETSGFQIIQTLRSWTEKNDAVLIVVGHVNKDGEFEGRNTIQHMFDCHLEMIFDKKKNTRTISWAKNRKGALDTLYYDFGSEKIVFYTTEQWEAKNEGKEMSDFVLETVTRFITMHKNHPQYKEMSKAIKEEWDNLAKTEFNSALEGICAMTLKAQEVLKRFGL